MGENDKIGNAVDGTLLLPSPVGSVPRDPSSAPPTSAVEGLNRRLTCLSPGVSMLPPKVGAGYEKVGWFSALLASTGALMQA